MKRTSAGYSRSKGNAKALAATAAALGMTGCSFLSPSSPQPAAATLPAPATQPEQVNADAQRLQQQIEDLYGTPGQRKNTPLPNEVGAASGDAPIAQTILPGNAVGAAKPKAVVVPATMAAEAGSRDPISAMGAMAAVPQPDTVAADPTMEQMVALLRHRVQANPKSINHALAMELLQLAEGGKAEDLSVLGVSADDSKVVGELASAVQSMSALPASPSATLAERTLPVSKAAEGWEAAADLKLPTIALASRVDSFGVYTPVEAKFPAGKRSVVIIYCEVANFTSEKSDDAYVTRLAQQDTLVTEDGLLVWRPNPEEIEDRCRNQRRDFYLIKKLTLPETLAAGKYTLRMTVTDKLGNKTDTAILPIEIVK